MCPTEMGGNDAHADRISDLPDEMLIEILSFMTTKEAIRTSMVAKRFQHLWASLPVLNFNIHEASKTNFNIHEVIPYGMIGIRVEDPRANLLAFYEKFVKLVEGVFEHREPLSLDSFNLVWVDEYGDLTRVTTWLDTVAKLKPKSLSVDIFTENDYEYLDSIDIAFETLQEFQFTFGFETIRPMSVYLPCLRKLTITATEIVGEFLQNLVGLPNLEEMVLCSCSFDISSDISSSTLKRLILDGHQHAEAPNMSISTPNLLFLEIHSWDIGRMEFKNLRSLEKAIIHNRHSADERPLLLTGLSNVDYFEFVLCGWGLSQMKDEIENGTTKFPTFTNLRTLKVGKWCMIDDFYLVARFLLHSPVLEKLTLLHDHSLPFNSKMETTLGLGDILKITGEKNDKSIDELVNDVNTHLKAIQGTN